MHLPNKKKSVAWGNGAMYHVLYRILYPMMVREGGMCYAIFHPLIPLEWNGIS